MGYLGQTFSYLKKNFLLPVLVMAVPAIAACFLSTPYWEVSFVASFDYDPYITADKTFAIVFGDSWQYIWPVVVVSILQVPAASLIMSAVDSHFRTGRFSMRSPIRLMNYSIVPITLGVIFMCLVSIIERFIVFGLIMFTQFIMSSVGAVTGAALVVFSIISVGMFFVHVLIITPMLYWAPLMFVYGYKLLDAAAFSFKMLAGKKVFWGLFVPMLACAGIQLLVGYLHVPYPVACTVNFFVFLFTYVYTTVYVIISFYKISELDRRDLRSYEYLTLPQVKDKPAKQSASDKKASREGEPEKPADKKHPAERGDVKEEADDVV